MEWQQIDTAPHDGTAIWAFCGGEQVRMKWIEGDGYALWIYDDELLADADPDPEQPNYWMPLPPPPNTSPRCEEPPCDAASPVGA